MGFRRLPGDACARLSARRLVDRTSCAARALLRHAPQGGGISARRDVDRGGDATNQRRPWSGRMQLAAFPVVSYECPAFHPGLMSSPPSVTRLCTTLLENA